MPTELGSHNARLERIRDLRSASGRREQSRYAVEGPTLIAEAGRSGLQLREIYAVPAALAGQPAIAALESAALPIFLVSKRHYARLSDLESPPGLLAVLDLPAADPQAILARTGPVLLLAGLNDPGNAGTLVRSAEAFGAAGVLFGRGGVDPYAPKVVRAAMGSLFRVPVAAVDADWLGPAAAAAGREILAADVGGEDVGNVAPRGAVIVAVGNERRGVRDWLPRWDRAIGIRQQGPAESLNAAVAGSIILYALSRPR